MDKVKDDVEGASQDQGKEEAEAGEVGIPLSAERYNAVSTSSPRASHGHCL